MVDLNPFTKRFKNGKPSHDEEKPKYRISAGSLILSPDVLAKDERVKRQLDYLRKKRKSHSHPEN